MTHSSPTLPKGIPMWVVYDTPIDYPHGIIARKFVNDKATSETLTGDTIQEVRNKIPKGFVRMHRHPTDDPNIVEIWI